MFTIISSETQLLFHKNIILNPQHTMFLLLNILPVILCSHACPAPMFLSLHILFVILYSFVFPGPMFLYTNLSTYALPIPLYYLSTYLFFRIPILYSCLSTYTLVFLPSLYCACPPILRSLVYILSDNGAFCLPLKHDVCVWMSTMRMI